MTRGNGAVEFSCPRLPVLAAGGSDGDAGAPPPVIVLGAGLGGILGV